VEHHHIAGLEEHLEEHPVEDNLVVLGHIRESAGNRHIAVVVVDMVVGTVAVLLLLRWVGVVQVCCIPARMQVVWEVDHIDFDHTVVAEEERRMNLVEDMVMVYHNCSVVVRMK
jgi:hypothetical protein